MANAVEDELAGPSVFKNRAVLDYDWVPERLLHRDAEIATLTQLFRGVATAESSQRALITGPVGTGKTALAKWFSQRFREQARVKGTLVEWVSVNCRRHASEGLVLLKVLQHFDPNYPQRGYGASEMLNDLRKHIDRRNVHLIVVLDEADALLSKDSELVYNLTRFDDERPIRRATLSLVMVSMKPDLHDMLDAATRSTVKRSHVVALKPYGATQLVGILRDRVALAFHKGTVDDEVLEMIAGIAQKEGDARLAIELLEGAGRAADEEHKDTVDAEHVRAVKPHLRSFVSEDKLRKLSEHQLYVLLGVARKLKRSRKTFLTTGEAEENYALAAEEFGDRGRAHTQFWKYLKELETADWLHLKRTEATSTGQTQHISLEDLPAGVLQTKIEGLLASRAKDARR